MSDYEYELSDDYDDYSAYRYHSDDDDDYMYADRFDDTDFSIASGSLERGRQTTASKNKDFAPRSKPTPPFQVPSLEDISSRLVALNFPFAYVERRNPPVPDELQLKIMSFSFPDNEEIIEKWAEFSQSTVDISDPQQLCASGRVKDLTQIGK